MVQPIENHMVINNADHDATHEPDEFERFAAEECVCLPEHWHELTLSMDQAGQMARAMSELIPAMSGSPIAINAVLSAMHRIRQSAINDILEAE